jgi:alpha-N-acetylglucosaminidase
MDKLLATNQNCLLGTWINDARKFGGNTKEKDYYNEDARKIITVWGEPGRSLTDYAN